jgi:predicted AlkP superfamily pyrophosphatase or phosphodiesterase
MPSVTPVNFGSIYSGAKPPVHGITKYEKKPITIETLFDVAARAGKKVALIASTNCSMGNIFPGRDIDYFHPANSYEVNAVAAKVLLEDQYDIVVIYNGNFDNAQHKFGPESPEALAELKHNSTTFALFASMIRDYFKHHNTLLGWITDHGCHEIDGGLGSHGLDMPEDINVVHMFQAFPKEEKKD